MTAAAAGPVFERASLNGVPSASDFSVPAAENGNGTFQSDRVPKKVSSKKKEISELPKAEVKSWSLARHQGPIRIERIPVAESMYVIIAAKLARKTGRDVDRLPLRLAKHRLYGKFYWYTAINWEILRLTFVKIHWLKFFHTDQRFGSKMPQLDTHKQTEPPLSSNIAHPLKNFRFDPIVTVGYTWSKDTYDRTPFIQATSTALKSKTPAFPTPGQDETLKTRFFHFQWRLHNPDFIPRLRRSDAVIMNPVS